MNTEFDEEQPPEARKGHEGSIPGAVRGHGPDATLNLDFSFHNCEKINSVILSHTLSSIVLQQTYENNTDYQKTNFKTENIQIAKHYCLE